MTLRDWRQGIHIWMCRSCFEENAAWVLKDQNPGERKCPYSGDRWERLPDVVGLEWAEPYRTMIQTVGVSSAPENGTETAPVVELMEDESALSRVARTAEASPLLQAGA